MTDLVKNTPETHQDLPNLNQALEKLNSVANQINESVRIAENKSKCFKIQNQILGCDFVIAPHRKFLKEGKFKKVCRKDVQPRMVWLFNDILLYAKTTGTSEKFTTGKKYKKPRFVFLANAKVEHFNESIYTQEKNIKSFQVLTEKKSFVFICETEEECSIWINSILTEIEREEQKKNSFVENSSFQFDEAVSFGKGASATLRSDTTFYSPVWLSDNTSESCMICANPFTLTNRRHHCRCW